MNRADIALYIYEESCPVAREDRLTACAIDYVGKRALSGRNFTLEREPGNKPFFPHLPEVHFSISHSGDWWLAAFHGAPVGLDIQKHSPRDYAAIAKRRYHPKEYQAVLEQGEDCFFAIWCAKESFCKMNGRGIDSSFAHFNVLEPNPPWQLYPLALLEGYSVCLCAACIGAINLIHMPN